MKFLDNIIKKIMIKRAVTAVNKFFDKEEKNMEGQKKWYFSKGVLSGVAVGVVAVYNTIAPNLGWPPIPEWVYGLLGATGIYGRATATKEIK